MRKQPTDHEIPVALSIAGSDSGGGAGIQADLKTFHQFGVYGTSVITALTAQNTVGVSAIHTPPPEFVVEQYRQVMTDIPVEATKTGMLATAPIINALAEVFEELPPINLVVDPVMISSTGARLLEPEAERALIERIIPLADLVTPNLHEAAVLLGLASISTLDKMREAAAGLAKLGPAAVLVKGGHLPTGDDGDEAIDILFDGSTFTEFRAPLLDQKDTHGTGCTLSAAITAGLAQGRTVVEAVGAAKRFVTEAIRTAPGIGKGVGPLNHFVPVRPESD
ncbi:bifunctional hydroxymethylpyrimidine kinase/phosphomethylpyrimidine kinase [Candidatus Zixiibacteriota bacterium]